MVLGTVFYRRTLSTSLPLRRVSDRHADTYSGAVIWEIVQQVMCSLVDRSTSNVTLTYFG